jgi:isoquinoline 1-oxidoreductase beta subunit
MAERKRILGREVDRRTLLIGGGVGAGLVVAWAIWPRTYLPNLAPAKGERVFGAWLKIGHDGSVIVAVPQAELGQGVYTAMPQILADELGADWKMVGVEPAPLNPLYANPLGAAALFEGSLSTLPQSLQRTHALRTALVITGGSSSIRAFEDDLRHAGAAARVLLTKAAARKWGTDWRACGTADGYVIHGNDKLGFGALVDAAAHETLPTELPLRSGEDHRLYGQALPRLDAPSKVDGSANFTADVRLPGMVFASIRQGPVGDTSLSWINRDAANKVHGLQTVVTTDRWVAAVGESWWAADRALQAMTPRFQTRGDLVDDQAINSALDAALDGDGYRLAEQGDLKSVFKDARVVTADYRVGLALHAALEPMTATAHYADGKLVIWAPTQAQGLARSAAARAIGISEDRVLVHPMMAGGSFGRKLEHDAVEQAAILAYRVRRPVQLTWSRTEDFLHDRFRTAAAARMTARLGPNGQILGWLAKIAAPATGRELARRVIGGDATVEAALAVASNGDVGAVSGAVPIYRIPNFALDHHPAMIGVPTGHWRGGAHSYTAFFNECFIDELAHVAGSEAISFRISMLGGDARLARCLSTVASLGGWQGGIAGSGQGVACHSFRGSHIAVLAEASVGNDQSIQVSRLVAAVDCGRVVNPDLIQQQIQGGLLFGMAAALGGCTTFTDSLADVKGFGDLGLPLFADLPDITIEIIRSESDPGGVGELGVPAVAAAIANAVQASAGLRLRSLPLSTGE